MKKTSSELGGAVVEMVCTVPLFAMLVGGMVFLGREVSLYGSTSQTTFNAALYAAGLSSSAVTQSEIQHMGGILLSAGVGARSFSNIAPENFSIRYDDTSGDGVADVVSVSFAGEMEGPVLAGFGRAAMRVESTMPLLSQGTESGVDPEFRNGASLYCANGSVAPGGQPANCGVPPADDKGETPKALPCSTQSYCKEVGRVTDIPLKEYTPETFHYMPPDGEFGEDIRALK